MADMQTVTMYSGDSGFAITPTVKENGTAVNITGSTVVFAAAAQGTYGGFTGAALITIAGSVTDGPNGVCSIVFAKADTDALAGKYYAEIELTDPGGDESTLEPFLLEIKPTLID